MPSEKDRRLETTLNDLQARWGAGVVRRPSALSTGFAALDRTLGIGGVPRGHLTSLLGVPTSGAGTLALKIAASATAHGEQVAYLDLTGTFDADYAARCGVDLERLALVELASPAAAVEALTVLVKAVGAAILPADIGPGGPFPDRAALRRLLITLHASSCALVVLTRTATDPFAEQATLRLELTRERWLLRRRDVRGYRARVRVLRNRFAPPGRPVSLVIGFDGAVKGDGA